MCVALGDRFPVQPVHDKDEYHVISAVAWDKRWNHDETDTDTVPYNYNICLMSLYVDRVYA